MERLTVELRRGPVGLQFSVKGGKEHGVPIIVSSVEEGCVARKKYYTHGRRHGQLAHKRSLLCQQACRMRRVILCLALRSNSRS